MFGAPDSDTQVEQTEKSIVASLKISDDEQDIEEEEDDDQRLSLPLYRQGKASSRRARRAGSSVVQNTTIPYRYRESLKLSNSD